jgi:hypothetical protein
MRVPQFGAVAKKLPRSGLVQLGDQRDRLELRRSARAFVRRRVIAKAFGGRKQHARKERSSSPRPDARRVPRVHDGWHRVQVGLSLGSLKRNPTPAACPNSSRRDAHTQSADSAGIFAGHIAQRSDQAFPSAMRVCKEAGPACVFAKYAI